MTTREILVEARKLIERPEDWTPYPGTGRGRKCALMALNQAYGGNVMESRAYSILYSRARTGVAHFNDSHSHAEVLDLFDRAIEAC